MTELKTRKTSTSVAEFLAAVTDPQRRVDAQAACALMAEVTGQPPTMWGTSIVGFGSYRYRYATGREGEWPAVGLSPRKQGVDVVPLGRLRRVRGTARAARTAHRRQVVPLPEARLSDVEDEVLRSLVRGAFHALHGTTVTT